jgi:hypothetical protein
MSELRKMTRMGGDLRKIARLLQDKGRNGDTILAHINPREAALLREQGGSGEINPETGLMEFEDGLGEDYTAGLSAAEAPAPAPSFDDSAFDLYSGGPEIVSGPTPVSNLDITDTSGQFTPAALAQRGEAAGPVTRNLAVPSAPVELSAVPQAKPAGAPAEKGFLESLSGGDKTRLGLAGVQGLSTALMARKARAGAQKGAEQIRQVGAPYTQQGVAERSAAQRGELTPVGQQQLDAMRARAAQAGVARGGVGVAQQQRAEEDLRQRLNAARESFGLQLSQMGDKYTMDAIKAGMQADAEVNQLYNQMFGNLARIAAPAAIQAGAK